MACSICGEVSITPLLVNEVWAGTLHSACYHAACEQCLQRWVASELPRCRRELQIRVRCFSPGCRKVLPQTLVQHVAGAMCSKTCSDIDVVVQRLQLAGERHQWIVRACPVCARSCSTLLRSAPDKCTIDHVACEECWRTHVAAQLERCRSNRRLDVPCIHPGCSQTLDVADAVVRCVSCSPEMVSQTLPFHVAARTQFPQSVACAITQEIERLKHMEGKGIKVLWQPADCSVCAAPFSVSIGPGCGHSMCEECWCRWVDEQLPCCGLQRRLRVRCIGCAADLDEEHALMLYVAASRLGQSLVHAATLRGLMRRRKLQANPLYPQVVQVDCPQEGCLGLGYLGSDTVMCFICEHQWAPMDEVPLDTAEGLTALRELVKACPACELLIEKNGGCDHMTCRCRHEFWWSTLKPYRMGGG